MLDLQLGRHARAIIEAMAPAQHRAGEIDLRLTGRMRLSRIPDLAIAKQGSRALLLSLRGHRLLQLVDPRGKLGLRWRCCLGCRRCRCGLGNHRWWLRSSGSRRRLRYRNRRRRGRGSRRRLPHQGRRRGARVLCIPLLDLRPQLLHLRPQLGNLCLERRFVGQRRRRRDSDGNGEDQRQLLPTTGTGRNRTAVEQRQATCRTPHFAGFEGNSEARCAAAARRTCAAD